MRLRRCCCLLACGIAVFLPAIGQARPQAPRPGGEETLVWLRDLESLGLGRVQWDAAAQVGLLSAAAATLEFRPGRREVIVWMPGPDGARVVSRHPTPQPPALVSGKLMVPLQPTCRLLGIPPPRLGPAPGAASLSAEDHPDPRAAGSIAGLVTYDAEPLAGIVLRLVRDEDSAFLPDRRAVSDSRGSYRFPRVRAGRYRVYAYVADNPGCFNRETSPITVGKLAVTAPPLAMGRVVEPVTPSIGARLPWGQPLRFTWTPCPRAAQYELSVTDPETNEEVAFQTTHGPEAEVPTEDFAAGRWYQWRVVALRGNGEFLGSTPGAGGEPWRFMVGAPDSEGKGI